MGKKQPAHEIKLGRIRVTIWANETEDHDVWFNAVVTRLYKNGNTWRETTTLRHYDLPLAMKAIDMAHSWICQEQIQLQQPERNTTNEALVNGGT